MMPLPFEPPWLSGGQTFPGWEPTGPVNPLGDLVDALTGRTAEPRAGFGTCTRWSCGPPGAAESAPPRWIVPVPVRL